MLDKIEKIDYHLGIALSELNKIAGGDIRWIGSIGELKDLVKAKLLIDKVKRKAGKAAKRKNRKY